MNVNLLKASEAARYLGITRQRIYELAQAGRLGQRMAGYWVFTQAELEAYRVGRSQAVGGRPKRQPQPDSEQNVSTPATSPLDDYLAAAFRYATVQPLPSGSFIGETLDFPGLIARGSSRAECMAALQERLLETVLHAVRTGEELPVIDGLQAPTLEELG